MDGMVKDGGWVATPVKVGFTLVLAGDGGRRPAKRGSWLRVRWPQWKSRRDTASMRICCRHGAVGVDERHDENHAKSRAGCLGWDFCGRWRSSRRTAADTRADLRPAPGAIEIVLGDARIRVVKGVERATLGCAAVRVGRADRDAGGAAGMGGDVTSFAVVHGLVALVAQALAIRTGARYSYPFEAK